MGMTRSGCGSLLDQNVYAAIFIEASIYRSLDGLALGDIRRDDGNLPTFGYNALLRMLGRFKMEIAPKYFGPVT